MEYSDKVKNRLRRAEGQIRGTLKMLEDEKDCKEVITQLSAIRSAIDNTMITIVGDNLQNCLIDKNEKDVVELVNDSLELFKKLK